MIFVSTSCIKELTTFDKVNLYIKNGIKAIELSGGYYEEPNVEKYQRLMNDVSFQVHNYFFPPKKPFVFNLASKDDQIAQASVNLAKNAIKLSAELERPIYSFHAGFLIDPKVSELGKPLKTSIVNDYKDCLALFIKRVNTLAKYASTMGVELLIENNVISEENLKKFGTNPFLMTNPNDSFTIMKNTADNVNMLLDVGHLKVSANSLRYDCSEIFTKCNNWIKAYHFSDNDGKSDSNISFDSQAWFWPYIKKKENYYSIEVNTSKLFEIKRLVKLIEEKLGN